MVPSQLIYLVGVRCVCGGGQHARLHHISPAPTCPCLHLLLLPVRCITTASILPPSWKKPNGTSNIYSCSYVSPPTTPPPPRSPMLCQFQIGLQDSSYSITNRPPTRPLTTATLLYGQGKMDRPNVSAQVIIRPHLFNEIRLSAPGKELRKQNASPPPLI